MVEIIIDDIAALIIAAGLSNAVTSGQPGLSNTDIYGWQLPRTDPNLAIAIVEYPGRSDPKAYTVVDAAPQWELPRIQIVARGDVLDYQTPRLRIEKIRKLLMQTIDMAINDSGYARFTLVSGPMAQPVDDLNRPIIVMSWEVKKSFTPVTIP